MLGLKVSHMEPGRGAEWQQDWRLQELAEQSESARQLDITVLSMENFKESSTFTFLKFHSGCKVEHRLREDARSRETNSQLCDLG